MYEELRKFIAGQLAGLAEAPSDSDEVELAKDHQERAYERVLEWVAEQPGPLVVVEAWVPGKLLENLRHDPFAGMESINCGLYPRKAPWNPIHVRIIFMPCHVE